jgi:hypothetical protein
LIPSVLVFEDFGKEFFVHLIELLEGGLEGVLIFAGGFVEKFSETIGGAVHEHLGVLDAFAVAGEIHVDELRVVVDLLEGGAGLVDVTIKHLLAGDLGHGVDELCVEEALVARACLLGTKFELSEHLGAGEIVVVGGGVDRSAERKKQRYRKKNGGGTKDEFHNAPRGSAATSCVQER